MDTYINYWKNQKIQRSQERLKQVKKARDSLEKITTLLVQEFQATKIILFGSLVNGKFDQESDIDLAVAGIPKSDYFRAFAAVNDIGDRPIDLKPLEDLEPYFLQKVLNTGECIYERNNDE
jgi:predicted nucleotidyltransferase